MRSVSTPADVSQRTLRRLVNFGTVSLARVLGNPPGELLTLRCECGARSCSATVEATAFEHHDDGRCLFMVAGEHAAAVPGEVVLSNDRFAMVRVTDPHLRRSYARRMSQSISARDSVRPAPASAGVDVIRSYFVAQARRPSELWDVDVAALTSYHRALLVNDGTVTRLIEASVLEPLTVDMLDQRAVERDDQVDSWLDLPAAARSIVRRRVAIHGDKSGRLYALAESLLATSQLSSAFTSSLLECPKGLGEILGQMRLETRRELLWFGYAISPGWAKPAAMQPPLLTRSYRIIIDGSPAILITESFPLTDPTRAAA